MSPVHIFRGTCCCVMTLAAALLSPYILADQTADDTQRKIATQSPDPWPRSFMDGTTQLLVYQPQVEQWQGNQITFRAAVSAKADTAKDETFGAVWATARTEVNRDTHMVTLQDIKLTRSNFPTLADNGAAYVAAVQQHFTGPGRTIALERLQASLAASQSATPSGVPVQNIPPQIIVSYGPAVLIPIHGDIALRDIPDSGFERVINTQALILVSKWGTTFYLHVYDGWLSSNSIDGPWGLATNLPDGLQATADSLISEHLVDPLSGEGANPPPSLANGVPAIFVSHSPAELLLFKGQPNFAPIPGTSLNWATNTTADVFVDVSNYFYVLVSGRWFSALSLDGPWSFVPSTALPPDFKRIPTSSPAAVVLSSVAGTPQAREAAIANSVPQTATVPRSGGPEFSAQYDGTPQLQPINGTPLQYVVNSATPVIQVDSSTYYALQAGVWFSATSLNGPWVVAAVVPEIIYTIPPSSSLYYVTFVHVYGSTPEVVYTGYTPGYLGTVVEPDGTVVYGTGYAYQPWIGTAYYPPPVTYGVQAQPVNNMEAGLMYGFGAGLVTAALVDSWNQPVYYSSYYHGYPCCGSTSANVYGHWNNVNYSGTNTWYSHSNGDVGESAKGTYTNTATGTTGSYSGNRYVNPSDDEAGRNYQRSFNTENGTTGNVSRGETYNANTGQTSYNSSTSATSKDGSTVTRSSNASWGEQGDSSQHETTVDNTKTGQTKTYSSGSNGNDHYADANGNQYHNDGSGWQKQSGSSGWSSAKGEDTSWADREQQARSQGENRFSNFSHSDGGSNGSWQSKSSGSSSFSNRFGGGGLGGRFGGRR